jgi:hypothetical protein
MIDKGMPPADPNRGSKIPDKPLSLHGMTSEEAIQGMFSGPPEPRAVYCNRCNEQITEPLVGEEGELRCPKCGTIAIDGNHS